MEHSAGDNNKVADAATSTMQPAAHVSSAPRPGSPSKAAANQQSGKRKRDRYTEKACNPCKARKIKCGGGTPCAACVRRKRPCNVSGSDSAVRRSIVDLGGKDSADHESVNPLSSRIEALESHLQTLNQSLLRMIPPEPKEKNIHHMIIDSASQEPAYGDTGTAASLRAHSVSNASNASPMGGLTFTSGKSVTSKNEAGATPMSHAIRQVEDRLTELGLPVVEDKDSAPETPPMTPLTSGSRDLASMCPSQRMPYLFHKHGISLTRKEWNMYVDTYVVEVHHLYPFFSEETIRDMCDALWRHVHFGSIGSSAHETGTDRIVQGLLILANGRCATSSRAQCNSGSHSAGWSLYCLAMEIHGNLLETANDDSKPMSSLQTLILAVLYLLRLDAVERAQKILSLAVVHAQHLGIHVEHTHAGLSRPQSELFKRVWWSIYVLDRRLALVLGRPFLVCDDNVGIGLNDEADEDAFVNGTSCEAGGYRPDSVGPKSLPYHYLNVMVGYSRVVGKIWEAVFRVDTGGHLNFHVQEYLDTLVQNWMESVPSFLKCDTDDIHQRMSPMSPALFKQRFLIQLRYLTILNWVRSPIRLTRKRATMLSHENMEADVICLQRARCIVNMFEQCSLADGVFGFPYLPHLLEATTILLACLTRLPNLKPLYKDTAETAISMLKTFYRQTWVSGKVARMIFKLGKILPQLFSHNTPAQETETSPSVASRQIDGAPHDLQTTGSLLDQNNGRYYKPYESSWTTSATTTSGLTDYHQYQQRDLTSEDFTEESPAATDFRFEDFPFELSFDTAVPQTSLLPELYSIDSGHAVDGFTNQSYIGTDVPWLRELRTVDGRHTKFV